MLCAILAHLMSHPRHNATRKHSFEGPTSPAARRVLWAARAGRRVADSGSARTAAASHTDAASRSVLATLVGEGGGGWLPPHAAAAEAT
eukprot:scaffold50346_cov55-Phaeocystis_antarctica.AAC.6